MSKLRKLGDEEIMKSVEEGEVGSYSFIDLPDKIILQILSKVIDFKTLLRCLVFSGRFSSIAPQIDTIHFTPPLVNPPGFDWNLDGVELPKTRSLGKTWYLALRSDFIDKPYKLLRGNLLAPSWYLPSFVAAFYGDSYRSMFSYLLKFTGVKSLCIELPISGVDNCCLFKWRVRSDNRMQSLLFLWPNSIRYANGLFVNGNVKKEKVAELRRKKYYIASQCSLDLQVRHKLMLGCIKNLPLLEKVSITDSMKIGTLSVSGGEVGKVRDWLHSSLVDMKYGGLPFRVRGCNVPTLKLPVSGCVMKEATLVVVDSHLPDHGGIGIDSFTESEDGFEDKEDAAYDEAMMEILEKHGYRMKLLMDTG